MKHFKFTFLILAILFAVTINLFAASEQVSEKKAQTVCPVFGEKIDKQVYADYNGSRIYFCCASCKTKFAKEPENYMKKMSDQGIELDKSPVLEQSIKTGDAQKQPVDPNCKDKPKTSGCPGHSS